MSKLHIEQTLQSILGIIQFGFGQELGVATYIGDGEVASVCQDSDLPCSGSKLIKFNCFSV